MPQFTISITETLSRLVTVEAEDDEAAYNLVRSQYNEGEIVLDSDDYDDVEFANEELEVPIA